MAPPKKSNKPLRPTDYAQRVIQATLDFANLDIGDVTTLEIEALFAPFTPSIPIVGADDTQLGEVRPMRSRGYKNSRQAYSTLGRDKWSESDRQGTEAYIGLQRKLRTVLADIASDPEAAARDHATWIDERLRELPWGLAFSEGRIVYRYSVSGVEAGIALGLAFLFDLGLVHDLRECPECGRVYVIFDLKRNRKVYCDECAADAHRESASKRQRQWRESQKRKKRGEV